MCVGLGAPPGTAEGGAGVGVLRASGWAWGGGGRTGARRALRAFERRKRGALAEGGLGAGGGMWAVCGGEGVWRLSGEGGGVTAMALYARFAGWLQQEAPGSRMPAPPPPLHRFPPGQQHSSPFCPALLPPTRIAASGRRLSAFHSSQLLPPTHPRTLPRPGETAPPPHCLPHCSRLIACVRQPNPAAHHLPAAPTPCTRLPGVCCCCAPPGVGHGLEAC